MTARLPAEVATLAPRLCPHCQGPLPEGSSVRRVYCSDACLRGSTSERYEASSSAAVQAQRQASLSPCLGCGGSVTLRGLVGKPPQWCDDCMKRKAREKQAARRAASRVERHCKTCRVRLPEVTGHQGPERCFSCREKRERKQGPVKQKRYRRRVRLKVLDAMVTASRPLTRGACVDGPRPCPWSSCRHHLGLDVVDHNKGERLMIREASESCALDVAARGPHTMEQVAEILGISKQAVEQIEAAALAHAAEAAPAHRDHLDGREITRGVYLEDDNTEKTYGAGRLWDTGRDDLSGVRESAE